MENTEFTIGASVMTVALLLGIATQAHAEEKVLRMFNWGGYTAPDLAAKFEKETGIKVSIDTYDSNETLLAKLSAGSAGYDIAVASADFIPILISQALVQPIDATGMQNYANLAPEWKSREWDPGNVYSVVWNWGTTSAVVDSEAYKEQVVSLGTIFEPPAELQGKIGMSGAMSEVISLALVYLGKPQCTAELDDLKALSTLLENQKPAVKTYDASGIAERLGSGELVASQAWSGAAYQARQQRPSLTYIYPKEGVYGWADSVVIPKTAEHPENAKLFVNFLMNPENAAILSDFTGSQNGVTGSANYMTKVLAEAPELNPPKDTKIYFGKLCSDAAIKAYNRIWTKLRG
ncbi:extracellular solute-binding protein [Shinella sp. CPCC 100929]|uniref:Putrescine-binding periplasmic protein n=1 Tax=Shinella lacus TaxID=2654216 RepID=A0ABT1RC27_9HYPH|nr:extracellular solute-binding protein [Shinella lacus]MCQ4632644.1 extracellular solute-binding protein [Shinella lacus]